MVEQEIVIGMGGSICVWTDVTPVTVVAIKGKRVGVTKDGYKVISGSVQDGSAEYEFTPQMNGPVEWYSLRKNGRFVKIGSSIRHGYRLSLGKRRRYYDPHF